MSANGIKGFRASLVMPDLFTSKLKGGGLEVRLYGSFFH